MPDILDTARAAGCFQTLLAAVEAGGLLEALSSPGPFTVFAPVDDAFAALPAGTVQTLVQNPPQLARILKYHVLSGQYTREQLISQPEWTTLEGATLPIRRADPFEVKNASVHAADVVCDNGIVHVINRVMLPG
ncbi:fasciclin domain-containing protein [Synechococcus sp. BA-124 BA4]|uniref:fasciclin domain-containing protein n=1 Tax=unclassified Synechococcus TaxID=2626047 RepID=UPI0018CDA47E|nr:MULTISPECIES: fasciclin domain-containing protein [unclassified Synechococcus]MEA5399979.1 fasciclin domain-containing protein [Synechococcus sp. BA-124 BA4]QPN56447.1 fasciclin domain-containing protein [Synechococcus sp. CBW1107]CAK6697422.1 Immunogenic protein MPT70 [Synechococcus sp. CBW1107]